jgi:hypothetical protein
MHVLTDRYLLVAAFSLVVGLIALTDSRMQIFAVMELMLAGICTGASLTPQGMSRTRLVASVVLAGAAIWALRQLDPQPAVAQLATATPLPTLSLGAPSSFGFPSTSDPAALPRGLQAELPTAVPSPVRSPITPTWTPTPSVSRPAPRAGGTPPGLAGLVVMGGVAAFGGGAALYFKRPKE